MVSRFGRGGGAMATRLVMHVRFQDQATAPEGDPPRFTVSGKSVEVTPLEGDQGKLPDEVGYETEVTLTGETSFTEGGTMTFGSDRMNISTVGEGLIGPSPEEGLLQGAVIWQLADGSGELEGATGLAVSDFAFWAERGEASEHQVITLFLP
jgi:hypothetical protein